MARRKISKKRDVSPDPLYNSRIVSKLINKIMKGGNKSKAESICYGCFGIIEKKLNKDPLQVF